MAAVSAAGGKQETIMEKPVYSDIYEKNIFDPKRRPWVEKVASPPPPALPALPPVPQREAVPQPELGLQPAPPPEPPAPPPAPPPVPPLTTADAEVYGVTVFGNFKKALIKLSTGLFKFAPQPKNKTVPRPFVTLGIGESLGPYTLKEITDRSVVFENGDAQYPLLFNPRKNDRPAGGPVSPMAQAPVILPAPVPTVVQGAEPVPTAGAQPQAAAAPAQPAAQPAAAQAPAAPAPAADTGAAAADAGSFGAQQPPPIQGRTLLEAIQAAQQARLANPSAPPPPNPFVKQ